MYQFCTLLCGDVFGWVACLFPQEKNRKLNPAGRRQKKKSRRTADTFPRAYEAVVLCQEKVQIKYNQFSLFM